MTISTNQFKNGTHIEIDGKIWKILDFQHVKPGKGGAFVRTKLRRIEDGSVIDKTFRAGEKFRPVRTESKKMQYLYDSGESAVFMDTTDYDQITIPGAIVGDAANFLLEQQMATIALTDDEPLYVELPASVTLEITYTEPGLQGDRSTGGTKPATVETGYEIQVPLFLEIGTKVKVDTRTGDYLGRVND